MHFHFVCNMNKFGRVLFIYIFAVAATGAAEFKSKESSTTATPKNPSSTTIWKPSSTTRWKQFSSTTSWKEPSSANTKKEMTSTTRWRQPTTTKAPPISRRSSYAAVNNGVLAVASISGFDSRNGRLSSMKGVKIYPGSSMVKTDDNGNYVFKSVDGKMPMPITITKNGDGVSNTIRISPGSVSVSSSASSSSKSGPASAVASYNRGSSTYWKPSMNDIYFPPFPSFPTIPDPVFDTSFQTRFPDPFPRIRIPDSNYQTRRQDPWFNKPSYRSNTDDIFKSNWYYPTFSPFMHFW